MPGDDAAGSDRLREVRAVRQALGERPRRWFTARDLELIVWLDDAGQPMAFQLAYDRTGEERAFTWRRAGSTTHDRVDDGEGEPGRHKRAPILLSDGAVPRVRLIGLMRRYGADIDPTIRELVLAVLRGEC